MVGSVVVCDMQNPALVAQYTRHATGLLELDSWVPVNDLGERLTEMHNYGFTSVGDSATAMKFTSGTIRLDDTMNDKDGDGVRQLVLCRIAVGRSVVISSEEDAGRVLPPGFHSFHLRSEVNKSVEELASTQQPKEGHRQEEERQRTPPREYYHEYILTNPHQILPQYLVRFRVASLERTRTDADSAGTCGMCEKQSASVACKACAVDLCATCDEQVHSANKIASRHARSPVSSRLSKAASLGGAASTAERVADLLSSGISRAEEGESTLCRAHGNKSVEFFCPVCDVPVCVSCKMVGDHSVGEKGAHRLLPISDAYEACLRETLRPDPLLDSRRAVVDSRLRSLRSLAESVVGNKQRVREAIETQYQRALQQLEACVAAKMTTIDSEVSEFERQAQQLEWVDASLDQSRSALGVVEFLAAWKQHKLLRADHHDFPSLSMGGTAGADQVRADLELVGDLQVMTAEQMMHRASWSGRGGDAMEDDPTESMDLEVVKEFKDESLSPSPSPRSRRPSDAEIRRRLLTMKTLPLPVASLSSPSRQSSASPSRPLSPNCQKVLEDIKSDLLARHATANSPSRLSMARAATLLSRDQYARSGGCLAKSLTPGKAAMLAADTLDAMRGLSVVPARRKPSPGAASPGGRQRDTWAAILRAELGGGGESDGSK